MFKIEDSGSQRDSQSLQDAGRTLTRKVEQEGQDCPPKFSFCDYSIVGPRGS